MAGLSCASTLQQAGLKVSVFEKSRGPSGRMSTRRAEAWQCDHGAQYFTARDPAFRAEVARWEAAGVAQLWQPRIHVFGGPAPSSEVSRWVGMPTMTAPADRLAAALTLHTETTIQALLPVQGGWQLQSAEAGWLEPRFDAVLLALPSPQAGALLQSASPQLASLAAAAPMRACWTLMLRFAEMLDLPFDAAFVNHGPLRWIARNNSKPGRSAQETWLLHATAEWTESHLEHGADQVAALLLAAFAELGGAAPQAWTAHRWLYATSDTAGVDGCLWRPQQQLGLCGDWLHGGAVEGAWLSGRELGREVLKSLAAPAFGADAPRGIGAGPLL